MSCECFIVCIVQVISLFLSRSQTSIMEVHIILRSHLFKSKLCKNILEKKTNAFNAEMDYTNEQYAK